MQISSFSCTVLFWNNMNIFISCIIFSNTQKLKHVKCMKWQPSSIPLLQKAMAIGSFLLRQLYFRRQWRLVPSFFDSFTSEGNGDWFLPSSIPLLQRSMVTGFLPFLRQKQIFFKSVFAMYMIAKYNFEVWVSMHINILPGKTSYVYNWCLIPFVLVVFCMAIKYV